MGKWRTFSWKFSVNFADILSLISFGPIGCSKASSWKILRNSRSTLRITWNVDRCVHIVHIHRYTQYAKPLWSIESRVARQCLFTYGERAKWTFAKLLQSAEKRENLPFSFLDYLLSPIFIFLIAFFLSVTWK